MVLLLDDLGPEDSLMLYLLLIGLSLKAVLGLLYLAKGLVGLKWLGDLDIWIVRSNGCCTWDWKMIGLNQSGQFVVCVEG